MPNEYEFMKSAKEKGMSDDEYKTLRVQYDEKAAKLGGILKNLVFALLGVYVVSFAALYICVMFKGSVDTANSFIWLAAEFLLAIFLYDPKSEDDKKLRYETDKKILLDSAKSKITAYKIKLGLVIFFGAVFVLLNVVGWIMFGSMESVESIGDLRLIYTALL